MKPTGMMHPIHDWLKRSAVRRGSALAGVTLLASYAALGSVQAAPSLPEIRVGAGNKVPACVTPERLMQFIEKRNPKLSANYGGIAALYRQHGDANGVRWDYAFFQMMLETANLKYGGDDRPKQNNFAGIGTTGGGVRGNAFPDMSTGVLAQIQHLIAYSGETVDKAVAPRTRENQAAIIDRSKKLARPVRFSDLQMRWAMDRRYADKIRSIADAFYQNHCQGRQNESQEAAHTIRLPTPVALHHGWLATAVDHPSPARQTARK
jgi:Mannosyl-glycoprotein endo-beta-N-acetylglucosaminidase